MTTTAIKATTAIKESVIVAGIVAVAPSLVS
jgi:hypothetical protein